MKRGYVRFPVIAFFVFLLIVESFLYFRHVGHFFPGDAVFLLHHRAVSVAEYIREFVQLHPSGWYRPLTNELIESVLYPVAGLHPVPYRIPVYAVFIAITILVYALVLALSGRHLASAIAVFFFTIHSVNAYTTYDVSFMPELLYTSFYIAAVLAFLRYLQNENRIAYVISLACFVGALLSKESAITLPAALLALHIAFYPGSRAIRERVIHSIRSTAPHMAILLLYLVFAMGYLHVMGTSVRQLVENSQTPNPGDYIPVLRSGMLKTADLAFTWAFSIPRGYFAPSQHLSSGMFAYLKFFRALVVVLSVVALFTTERKLILFGFAWFWITILPALTLVSHFVPYYLFLPVVGLSLVVGTIFVWLYDVLRRVHLSLAALTIALVLAGVLYVNSSIIHTTIKEDSLLGGSSTIAGNTLNDLKHFYPVLPTGTTLYFADAKDSLLWHHDSGGLIQMAYGTDQISTFYESQSDSVFALGKDALVFRVVEGRLIDETANFRSNPVPFMKFSNSDLKLALSRPDVLAGRDTYAVSIKGLSDMDVRIAYTMNDQPLEVFLAHLDSDGKVTFDVAEDTPKGMYRFFAFNVVGTNDWVRTDEAVTVH